MGEFCIRLPRSHPVPAQGPRDVSQTAHLARYRALVQPPQTPAALLTSVGPSLANLGGISCGASSCAHPGLSPHNSPGPRALTFPRTQPPCCALRSGLRAQPTRTSFIAQAAPAGMGVVALPPPPMAARFGRAGPVVTVAETRRGGAERRGGTWAGQGQHRGRDLAGALHAVISFCLGSTQEVAG